MPSQITLVIRGDATDNLRCPPNTMHGGVIEWKPRTDSRQCPRCGRTV